MSAQMQEIIVTPSESPEDVNISEVIAVHREFQQLMERILKEGADESPEDEILDVKMEEPEDVEVQNPEDIENQNPGDVNFENPENVHFETPEDVTFENPEDIDFPVMALPEDNDEVKITYVKKEVMDSDIYQLVDDLLKFVEYSEDINAFGISEVVNVTVVTAPEASEPPPKRRRLQMTSTIDIDDLEDSNDKSDDVDYIPSDSESGPVSMKKKRDPKVYKMCLKIAKLMTSEFNEAGIQDLIDNEDSRIRLYKRYVQMKELKNGRHQEDMPIYAFLMAPETKKTYLEAVKIDKIRTKDDMHVNIFKASRIHDADTSEVLKMSMRGDITADKLKTCLLMIQKKMGHWRDVASGVIKRFTMEVKEEMTRVEEIPEEGFLVCFEEMPDFSVIQSKKLKCMVIKPSKNAILQILQNTPEYVNATVLESAYGGSQGTLPYLCFGPGILELDDDSRIRSSSTLSAAFKFCMNEDNKKTLTIYSVNGYF